MVKSLKSLAIVLAVAGTSLAQTAAGGQTNSSTSGAANVAGQSATGQANSNTTGNAGSTGQSVAGQASSVTSTEASAAGQSASAASQQTVQAVLTKSVDAKKAKQGDKVEAKTTQAIKGAGNVEIPKGTKLIGHVTQVKARGKESHDSTLGIAFDNAILKHGQQVPFHAMIAAISAPAQLAPSADMGMDSNSGVGAGSRAGSPMGSGGGPLGGVGNTVGGVTQTAGQTAGSITGGAASTVGSVGSAAGSTVGSTTNTNLGANTQGVMGLPGVTLNAAASNETNGSVFNSSSKNVKLDSGSTLVLRVMAQ